MESLSFKNRNQSPISTSSEGSGERPYYQRAASSTSRNSIQLSGISLGQPASDAEASWSAPAGRERTLTSTETSQDYTIDA